MGSQRFSKIAVILICLALSPVILGADIYKWVDKNGKVHFGDRPSFEPDNQITKKFKSSTPSKLPLKEYIKRKWLGKFNNKSSSLKIGEHGFVLWQRGERLSRTRSKQGGYRSEGSWSLKGSELSLLIQSSGIDGLPIGSKITLYIKTINNHQMVTVNQDGNSIKWSTSSISTQKDMAENWSKNSTLIRKWYSPDKTASLEILHSGIFHKVKTVQSGSSSRSHRVSGTWRLDNKLLVLEGNQLNSVYYITRLDKRMLELKNKTNNEKEKYYADRGEIRQNIFGKWKNKYDGSTLTLSKQGWYKIVDLRNPERQKSGRWELDGKRITWHSNDPDPEKRVRKSSISIINENTLNITDVKTRANHYYEKLD